MRETKDHEINLATLPREFWASRSSRIRLTNVQREGLFRFNARATARQLYDYFPFNVLFYVNGQCVGIIEIGNEHEVIEVTLPIYYEGDATLTILSEQGAVPAQKGVSDDVRELSVCLTDFAFIPVDAPLRRPQPQILEPNPGAQKLFPSDDRQEPRPIFVIGCYRSGTSVMTWAVGQHPDIFPMEETNWLSHLCLGALAAYRTASSAHRSATRVYDITEKEFLMWQGAAIDRLHRAISTDRSFGVLLSRLSGYDTDWNPGYQLRRSRFAPKSRWIDGTPENTGLAHILTEMFPAAKFIYLLRKPREVMTSLINFHTIGGKHYTAEEAADEWERLNRLAYLFLHSQGRDRVMLALYDDLVEQPAKLLDRIWNFIGEPPFQRSLETFSSRVNSSSKKTPLVIDEERMKVLDKIYRQIMLDVPPDRINWSRPDAGTLEAQRNDIVERLRRCFE
jgi:hypothetical protein